MILHENLRSRTLKGKGYHVISMDVDTVSYCSISGAFDCIGIPKILPIFDATTSIKGGTATI